MEHIEIIRALEDQLKKKISSFEQVEDNDNFKLLLDKMDEFVEVNNFMETSENQLKIQSFQIISVVEIKKKAKVKLHNCITFILPDESLIRFSSFGLEGIELTRIEVRKENQRKGRGTYLMTTFINFIEETIGFIPTIFLECTSGLGMGNTLMSLDISKQTKFFRKFGFRVKERDQYPNYVSMVFENDNNS